MSVELIKIMEEHTKTNEEHTAFYELADEYDFCTPWCHLENDCSICKKKSPLV